MAASVGALVALFIVLAFWREGSFPLHSVVGAGLVCFIAGLCSKRRWIQALVGTFLAAIWW